ncbi:MAG: signal peptidase [Bacilli bacterium]|nr:signal peptidase [Bacilli bacterium]
MEQENTAQQPIPAKNEIWEWIKALAIAGILVVVIRMFIFAPFIVDGPSMQPNFVTGERLIVNEIIYSIRKPHRGEVVVFHAPEGKDYIKRVIGLPGDTIKIANNKVYLNGKVLDEDYIRDQVTADPNYNQPFNEITIPAGTFFAMGDNRKNSNDSRMIGPMEFSRIVGRADFIFWPLDKIKFVHQ